MSNKDWVIWKVAEQSAIFDGDPEFMDMLAVLNLLNHYSYPCMDDAEANGCDTPKKYAVRVIVETKELP